MVPTPTSAAPIAGLGDTAVDTDAVLRALADARRRHALSALAEAGPLSLDALATRVVARECDCDEADSSQVVEQDVRISLYHTHAPLLADAGLVTFDAAERTVAITDLGRELQPVDPEE